MADRSPRPGHGRGSEDLSDDFHPANEWLEDEDDDENDMDYEPGSEHRDAMLFFDADDGEDEDENEDEEDVDEEESEEDNEDDGAAATGIFREFATADSYIKHC